VQKGYKDIEVHEVYEYDVTNYDPAIREGGPFVQYINTFQKLKDEANGLTIGFTVPETKTVTFKNLMRMKETC
jgi:hypothetical protein